MYNSLFDKAIQESFIDYPRTDLDQSIWENEDGYYFLREEVKSKILNLLDQYPEVDLLQEAREIRIVGSLGSNLFVEDSDLDLHIIPKDFSEWPETRVKEVMNWYKENEELDKYVKGHPIEVYVQTNPNQDLMSVAVYDVLEDNWLVGPKIVPLDYDPYSEFEHIANDVRQAVQDADLLMGELKRDVIDFETIENAIHNLPKEHKLRLYAKAKNKLEEIEKDIQQLYLKRKEWVDARHNASRPQTPEEAREDVELARKWKDTNALFKFVNRYEYLKLINKLEELLKDDGEITPNEVDIIRGMV